MIRHAWADVIEGTEGPDVITGTPEEISRRVMVLAMITSISMIAVGLLMAAMQSILDPQLQLR
jgi:hypothetical protein